MAHKEKPMKRISVTLTSYNIDDEAAYDSWVAWVEDNLSFRFQDAVIKIEALSYGETGEDKGQRLGR
jgi:hypothetical protein